MGSYRVERANEEIKNELTSLIQNKLNDPRVKNTVISVTRTKTTPDMKYCKVYVAIFADKEKREEILAVLDSAKGFLRKNIAEILSTKFTPELIFELDDSLDYAMHIEKLLNRIKDEEQQK